MAGTIAVDEVKYVSSYPNRSELASIIQKTRFIGGAVSNCSTTLARIDPNLPIEAIAIVGDDDKGRFLKKELSKFKNIDLKQVKEIGETTFTDVIHDLKDNTRTFFTYKGNGALFDESFIDLDSINSSILHIGYILLLDALDKEDSKYGTKMARLLKHAQDKGIKTSIDIVSENSDRYEKLVPPSLKFVNYCIVNEIEAGKSVGIPLRDSSGKLQIDFIKVVLVQLKKLGVQDWVVIHAPESSFGYDGTDVYSIPSLQIDSNQIMGTVGAGDAYASGVLYGAWLGHDLPHAMKIGTAAAGSSLFKKDSSSGVRPYKELVEMYESMKKQPLLKI